MKKVLLIEDDSVVRENTAELLELANYNVIKAENGKIGVSKAKKHLPDIIICDIMMPDLNGFGVLQILSKEKTTKQIPFIFLSAKSEHKDIRKGMNLGADDYITKPFDESELFSAVESRLAKVAILNDHNNEIPNNTIAYFEDGIKSLEQLKNYFTDNIEEFSFNPGEIIYHNGDNSNYVFLIKSGAVKTYKIDDLGKELITALHKEEDFFGLTSFTHNIPYMETATAIENTIVFRLLKNEFKKILNSNHSITLELVDYLSDNVSNIKEHLLEMAYSSVRKKTASTILKFSKKMKNHPEDTVKISRGDLASIAGIATETFIRTLSDFKKDGLIDVDGRNIKIIDIERLKKVN